MFGMKTKDIVLKQKHFIREFLVSQKEYSFKHGVFLSPSAIKFT